MTPNRETPGNRGERLFIWGGAGLFGVSLAATATAYVTQFAAVADFAGAGPAIANTLLFALFAVHHSAFARERLKTALLHLLPPRLLRPVYVWTSSLLLLAVVIGWRQVGGVVYDAGWARWILLGVQGTGALLLVAAVRRIRALELAGVSAPVDQRLETSGPYQLVRHPLYLGWVLVVFAPPSLTGDRLLFALLSTVYLVIAVQFEERDLRRTFGREYRDYATQVRSRLFPFLY